MMSISWVSPTESILYQSTKWTGNNHLFPFYVIAPSDFSITIDSH